MGSLHHKTCFRLSGCLDRSMLFVNPAGRLEKLLPLGCILSFAGLQASLTGAVKRQAWGNMSPEMKVAVELGMKSTLRDPDVNFAADSYAAATLVRQALAQHVSSDRNCKYSISDIGEDFLRKAMYDDPSWRLCADDALSHPWFTG